jgi:hypothetical protein
MADTFGRELSAESLLNYPDLVTWVARAFADPRQRNRDVVTDVVRELTFKGKLYRDLARIGRGKRLLGRTWDAWGGAKPEPPEQASDSRYVAAAQPQRSDLTADDAELSRRTLEVAS